MVETNELTPPENDFFVKASRRISFWGLVIAGLVGLGLANNAAREGEHMAAGVILIATVLDFAVLGRIFRPGRGSRRRWRT